MVLDSFLLMHANSTIFSLSSLRLSMRSSIWAIVHSGMNSSPLWMRSLPLAVGLIPFGGVSRLNTPSVPTSRATLLVFDMPWVARFSLNEAGSI